MKALSVLWLQPSAHEARGVPKSPTACEPNLGFRVWVQGSGFGVRGLRFGVWGLGFGVWGLGCGDWGFGFRFGVLGLGFC